VTARQSDSFARDGFPDAATKAGFVSYVRSLVSVLNAHHLAEDEVAFPYLLDRLPDAPFAILTEDHRRMESLLEEIAESIDEVEEDADASAALSDLNGGITWLTNLWEPHIRVEEEQLSPEKAEEVMDAEEQGQLSQQIAKHGQENSGPDYLVVPFVLYNLSKPDRAIMAQAMPPAVTQELVPGVWKEQWAPMKPFLLS
jgi:hemerythrin-like domain-containing protein